MPLLVAGEGGQSLAQKLAHLTHWPVVGAEFKTFPDGEEYAKIQGGVKGQDVVVLQTTYPPSRLWKLLLLLSAARENGASTIRCVVPYLAYARQDRVFLEGEALSARLVADSIRQYATDCVTVDLHKDDVRKFFGGVCQNLSAAEPFAKEFKAKGIEVVLAPDAGALDRAKDVAGRIGARFDHLEKKRVSSDIVEMRPKALDVAGKKVAILDDIISTGGTMAKATEQLVAQKAVGVVCAGVHGLFMADAVTKLKKAGAAEILASDTIDSPYSRVSVAELIAHALTVTSAARTRW